MESITNGANLTEPPSDIEIPTDTMSRLETEITKIINALRLPLLPDIPNIESFLIIEGLETTDQYSIPSANPETINSVVAGINETLNEITSMLRKLVDNISEVINELRYPSDFPTLELR